QHAQPRGLPRLHGLFEIVIDAFLESHGAHCTGKFEIRNSKISRLPNGLPMGRDWPILTFLFHMSTKSNAAAKSSAETQRAPERGPVMNGAEILVHCLEREG